MGTYVRFSKVYDDVLAGRFANEAELRQAFVEALKGELQVLEYDRYVADHVVSPAIDEVLREGRPDVRLFNFIVEVEAPQSGLSAGRSQLHRYMGDLFDRAAGRIEVLGLVTDGDRAEFWVLDRRGFRREAEGDMPRVAALAIQMFCSRKIPVVTSRDLVRIFGV